MFKAKVWKRFFSDTLLPIVGVGLAAGAIILVVVLIVMAMIDAWR